MKIYTKTGDSGETQVYADEVLRLPKDHSLLAVYGELDSLNAQVGMLVALLDSDEHKALLTRIQRQLFAIGFVISASSQLSTEDVTWLEQQIDELTAPLPALTRFVLPGGCPAAAQAHVCRTQARSAERALVTLAKTETVPQVCLQYINRLSDLFFTFARSLNHQAGVTETTV